MIHSSNLTTPPDGNAVERLGIVIAASVGHYWLKLDPDMRQHYRLMANAALITLGLDAHAQGLARVKQAVERMAQAQRNSALVLEALGTHETNVVALHKGANNCDAILLILDAVPGEEEALEPLTEEVV